MLSLLWATGCAVYLTPEADRAAAKVDEGETLELVWHAVPTTTHPPCAEGVATFDTSRGVLVYVGTSQEWYGWDDCNSTWVYDGTDWAEVADTLASPPARFDASLTYDPIRERVVMFGGRRLANGAYLNEVWEWDGLSWQDRTPIEGALQPEPMAEPGLAFDPVTGKVLAFGGTIPNKAVTDTWAWDGSAWTLLDTDGPWTLPLTTWDGEQLIGAGNGTRGFGGWDLLTWDGAGWTEAGWTPFSGPPLVAHDPSPGVTLFAFDPTELYWLGPDGVEVRGAIGDAFPSPYWNAPIFVYDPVHDRTVAWQVGYGDTVMELEARVALDAPPAFVDPPDVLTFDIGYEDSYILEVDNVDGDPITLTIEDKPDTPWPTLKAYTSAWALRWSPAEEQTGEHVVTLVLSDGTHEVRHPVTLVAGKRHLEGFPDGSFEVGGLDDARVGESEGSNWWDIKISCTLTVDNPGEAWIGCAACLPFRVEAGESTTDALVDRVQLSSGSTSFLFEEWGTTSSPTPLISNPWTWARGEITEVEGGWQVTVSPSIPADKTDLSHLDGSLITWEAASIFLPSPRLSVYDLQPGDLVVTEIMRNPAAVYDSAGEWLEIHNRSGAEVDLQGLEVRDADSDQDMVTESLVVAPGGYVVLGVSDDEDANGGVVVDYVLGDLVLANGGDELILEADGTVLDAVEWTSSWLKPNGASMSLDPASDAVGNDDVGAWCSGAVPYGLGDRGTPGAENPPC